MLNIEAVGLIKSLCTRNPVRWKSKKDLSELRGRRVYLHFRISGAVLYSFRFTDDPTA